MKSITVHNMDDNLVQKISEKARQKGLSLNKTIKNLLQEALGLQPKKETDHTKDFQDLCGIWTDEDLEEFESSTADLDRIDPEDWK